VDGVLPVKLPSYDDYSSESTALCERVLLTVWGCLRDYQEHLVLIGGLVPRYLCGQARGDYDAQTIDVDFGIALAADSSHYDPVSSRLASNGFELKPGTGRFARMFGAMEVAVDFLTERESEGDPEARMVDDVRAQAILGLDRALRLARVVHVSGTDVKGARVTEAVRVCEVGPFLCLKLAAYARRAEGKDVFDAVRAALDYDQGFKVAIRRFQDERPVNKAFAKAASVLRERFADADGKGPVDYAEFCLSGRRARLGRDDSRRLFDRLRNEACLLGRELLDQA
jgi:hypothetical protein